MYLRHHSSSIRQVSRTASTVMSPTVLGSPAASSSTFTCCGTLSARILSLLFPLTAHLSRFKVDQRVPPLGETRPGLHLDDVVQHRPFDPQRDLPDGALERAPPPGATRGARITREP